MTSGQSNLIKGRIAAAHYLYFTISTDPSHGGSGPHLIRGSLGLMSLGITGVGLVTY